jgi:hypothetical protein
MKTSQFGLCFTKLLKLPSKYQQDAVQILKCPPHHYQPYYIREKSNLKRILKRSHVWQSRWIYQNLPIIANLS